MRNEHIYATPAQESYLARLIPQAQAKRCLPYAVNTSRRMLKSEASRLIDAIKAALVDAKNGINRRADERRAREAVRAAQGGSVGDGYEMSVSYCDGTRSYRVMARFIPKSVQFAAGMPWTNCGTVGWAGMPAAEIKALATELANRWIAHGLVE